MAYWCTWLFGDYKVLKPNSIELFFRGCTINEQIIEDYSLSCRRWSLASLCISPDMKQNNEEMSLQHRYACIKFTHLMCRPDRSVIPLLFSHEPVLHNIWQVFFFSTLLKHEKHWFGCEVLFKRYRVMISHKERYIENAKYAVTISAG